MAAANKRLCFVLENYWEQCMGGAELQTSYLEQEALRWGWNTYHCFVSNGSDFKKHSETSLYPILQKKIWNKLGNIKYPYAGSLLQALKQIRPQIIYQRCLTALTGIAAYYAKKNNIKMIFHIASDRDVTIQRIPLGSPWLLPERFMMHYGIKNADIIIAQTQHQALLLKKNYNRKAVVIPNGHPVPKDIEKPKRPVNVLWVANWKPIKQPEIFVQMVEALAHPAGIRFIMVGRTHGYEPLVRKAQHIGIKVLGEIPNDKVNDLLAQSHLLVNTSKQEGFSNTFIQAWLRRVPVLSLQVDPDDVIEKNRLGYCAGCFNDLIQLAAKLINDHGLVSKICLKSRGYAVEHHSLVNMEKILELMAS